MNIAIIEPDHHQASSLWAHLIGIYFDDEIDVFENVYDFLTSPKFYLFDMIITEQRLPFQNPDPAMKERANEFPELVLPTWNAPDAGTRLIAYLRKKENDIFAIIYTTDDIPPDEDDDFVETIDDRTVMCYKGDNWRSLDNALNS